MFCFAYLPRAVLLREHTRKPITRTEIKDHVMPEHKAQDRSGKIFKQVLAVANEKLGHIFGLKLVDETDAGAGAADDAADDADGGGAGASQAGPSQAAGASQAAAGRGGGGVASGGPRYMLVNLLPHEKMVTEPLTQTDEGQAIYLAFVEVILAIIAESQDKGSHDPTWVKEDELFGHLRKLGLEPDSRLPPPAEPEKVESLVQKRLVNEAFLRRRKQKDRLDAYEYLRGARAVLCRDERRAGDFLANLKKGK